MICVYAIFLFSKVKIEGEQLLRLGGEWQFY
jgi:hypothetical protein